MLDVDSGQTALTREQSVALRQALATAENRLGQAGNENVGDQPTQHSEPAPVDTPPAAAVTPPTDKPKRSKNQEQ